MPTVDRVPGPCGRARLADVVQWIDAWTAPLAAEEVVLSQAAGRVAAGAVVAPIDLPPFDRAAADGYAVRADDTVGANAYSPLPFRLMAPAASLSPGCAVAVASGEPLPAGADAVVRLEHAQPEDADRVAIIAPAFAGNDVERAGSHAARDSTLAAAGRRLGPCDIGLLAAAGLQCVAVVGRPRVRCVLVAHRVAEPARALPPGMIWDANGPLLAALVARDGGLVLDLHRVARDPAQLRDAMSAPGADVVLVAGATGPGPGDCAAAALAEAGELAVHGVAIRPGDTAGAGRIPATGAPVFLLPGAPASCLWSYELLAGRAVRRLGGLAPDLPFPVRTLRLARKLVSDIGLTEVCPVHRTGEETVEPALPFAEAGLAAAAEADGFVLVPEASEGYPEGATVAVHLLR